MTTSDQTAKNEQATERTSASKLSVSQRAKAFADRWKDRPVNERGGCQPFWIDLLASLFEEESVTEKITFEYRTQLDGQKYGFIDAYIPATRVLIEQKNYNLPLNTQIQQSDGTLKTPFEQAKRYNDALPLSEHARWIVTSNFREFHIHDMEHPKDPPTVLSLNNFEKDYKYLGFLVDPKNDNIHKEKDLSIEAGAIVGRLYDCLLTAFDDKSEKSLRALNVLCVRLVFCLYAEDAGLFPKYQQFYHYLKDVPVSDMRDALLKLFNILNTAEEDRSKYEKPELLSFPYVNGGLFDDNTLEIPQFTEAIKHTLLQEASADFDWSGISPTIFGAVFESTLNPETRRKGGMHYTSVENIHKVIDPLFLDELYEEFDSARRNTKEKTRKNKLQALHNKIASLSFLDPACGSGNFLTETYLSLRRLENDIIRIVYKEQGSFAIANPVKVNIDQFYGIEINDFAVSVAKTALWIAESQMRQQTESIVELPDSFLPLKSSATIVKGNALRMDWANIVAPDKLNYIMGNPPFVGYTYQTDQQREDIVSFYQDETGKLLPKAGKMDYVSCWFYKCAQFIQKTVIRCALVATNSITQGELVTSVWQPVFQRFNIHIDFAYTTFKWTTDTKDGAAVHVVIIGFSSAPNANKCILFKENERHVLQREEGKEITPYLTFGKTTFIESRKTPVSPDAPAMTTGNRPADGGNLLLTEEEYQAFIQQYPKHAKWIKKFTGADEYINNISRYCLWLVGIEPHEIKACKEIERRIRACKEDRLNGASDRQKLADTPHLFRETKNPAVYLIVPLTSSENRKYIPFGFLGSETIASNAAVIIPDATPYHFGILSSSVHMAWMRAVAGRLKSDYRYSKDIVYNNFIWPKPADKQRAKIEETAKAILTAREAHQESSLAELYDPLLMPPDLRKAHKANDTAVLKAYGFEVDVSESDIVAELFKRYEARVAELNPQISLIKEKKPASKRKTAKKSAKTPDNAQTSPEK